MKITLDAISALKQRWFEIYPQFAHFRDSLLAKIVRWEYANGARYDPRPFYFLRDTAKGRLLRRKLTPDTKEENVWVHGYDHEGQIVLIRSFRGTWEAIYIFADNYVEILRVQGQWNILRGISRLYSKDGFPSHYLDFAIRAWPTMFEGSAEQIWQNSIDGEMSIAIEQEHYVYSGGQLTRIDLTRWDNGFSYKRQEQQWETEYDLTYNAAGKVEQIDIHILNTGYHYTKYRERQPSQTLTALTEQVKAHLVETIPRIIEQASFSEPLYCLQLSYHETNFFPPVLLPGLESARVSILSSSEKDYVPNLVWGAVWDFGAHEDESYARYPIGDEQTLRACAEAQRVLSARGYVAGHQRAVKTLYQIATALNQVNWSAYAPVTDDFIVFAFNDREELWRALRLSGASSEQIIRWRMRGLL